MMWIPKRCPKPRKRSRRAPHQTLKKSRLKSRGKRTKKSGGALFWKRRDPVYREWIRMWACLLRGCDPAHQCPLGIFGAECAHVKSRGAGGDDFANCVPLCAFHHAQQHRLGIKTFERRHGFTVSLAEIARDLGKQYQDGGRGIPSRRDAERIVGWVERGGPKEDA
jgi:hypothetical protein